MNKKFKAGDSVAYKPKRSPSIEMKETKVVGFDSICENKWRRKYSEVAKDYRHVLTNSGKEENRYVIEHFFGWYPVHQRGNYNSELQSNIDPGKRYQFAFESELKHTSN